MRIRLAPLFIAFACGDSGGSTTTTTTTDPQTSAADTTGTSTSTTTTTTGDTPTGSGSADASSGGASTGPDPTTGAVLTATGDMSTSTTVADTTSTTGTTAADTSTTSTTSTTADDTTTSALPECDGADVRAILDAFIECPSPGYLGQTKPISGVTCWDICCAFGTLNCGFRAAQADYNACDPMNAQPSGDCSDVFQMQWSSQCNCLN